MRRSIPLAAAALVLALAAPVAAADVQLPTEPMSAEDTAAIDAGMAAVMEANPEVPAFYIGVWDPERGVYQQAYGLADVAAGRAAGIDDHFRIGSISKTFMATVMLQLIDEGELSPDDTVAAADPDLAERHPALADITIEQLLGMTSGIPDYMNVPDAAVAALAKAPDTVWSSDQLIGFGADGEVQPAGTPGYSTTGYIALQEIAESLTGQTIGDLIAERITEPLGMTGTALPPNEDTTLPEPVSRGYLSTACIQELVADGAEAVPLGTDTTDWNASYGQSGGGMHSTIADLGTWAASMSGNALLSDELAEARLQVKDIGAIPFMYGLGIIQFGNEWGHEGEAIGWEGWAGHDPDTGLSAVIATNTCADTGALFQALGVLDPAIGQLLAGS
ncbi:MAG: serine hydrolase [Chloroflexota bacterium]|nr:serine hydrolase [Chloroflexota bacterium]